MKRKSIRTRALYFQSATWVHLIIWSPRRRDESRGNDWSTNAEKSTGVLFHRIHYSHPNVKSIMKNGFAAAKCGTEMRAKSEHWMESNRNDYKSIIHQYHSLIRFVCYAYDFNVTSAAHFFRSRSLAKKYMKYIYSDKTHTRNKFARRQLTEKGNLFAINYDEIIIVHTV